MDNFRSSVESQCSSDESEYESLSRMSSNEGNEEENEETLHYDDSIEPVPTEEEAADYLEQLALEEEEEQTLLSRFSGEEDVRDWCKCSNCSLARITKPEECWCCKEIDRCGERMYEVEMEDKCIIEHPGYSACCLNTWVLSTAAVGLKTKAKKSYSATKTETNAAEDKFLRSVAYRQYVRLVYEYVGSGKRIPLPNCVYNNIRKAFPNPEDQYTGYEEEDAYSL